MHRTPLLLLLLALLALAAPAGAEDLTQTVAVSRPGRLLIQLDRGSVDVMTHAEASVFVQAERRTAWPSSVASARWCARATTVVLRARNRRMARLAERGAALGVQVSIPPFFEVGERERHALVTRREAVELSYPTRAVGNRTR